jgi:hypothetical protein
MLLSIIVLAANAAEKSLKVCKLKYFLVCYLWIHRNIRIASLPSYSPILHGSVSFVPVAARSFLLQSTGFFPLYRPSISQSLV